MNIQSLQKETQKVIAVMEASPWEKISFYQNWLAQTHYYTSYSTRLLAYSAGWSHPSQTAFYRRFVQHIKEEQGHDVIATNDLGRLDGKIEEFAELGVTRALWEPQFYKVQKNPTFLLGYILSLEMIAAQGLPQLYKRLLTTYSPEQCRFIKIHAEEDPDHVEEAIKYIALCEKSEQIEIMKNFEQTNTLYSAMLQEIAAADGWLGLKRPEAMVSENLASAAGAMGSH